MKKNRVDNASLIEWTHTWRKALVQNTAPDNSVQIEEISRYAQRSLCGIIISQMLMSRNLPDAGCWQVESNISSGMLAQAQKELSKMALDGLPFEVLGDIYESYLAEKKSALRKGRGIYYTPRYVVRYIVDRTLGRYLWGTENGRPGKGASTRKPADIRHLRILDPACGSGHFLAYAFDVLANFYALHNLDISLILEDHLCGVDIDSDAVNITCMILSLKAMERAGLPIAEIPKPNVKQGDFLIPESPVFSDNGGFTMILGNPPYGAKLTRSERETIKSNYETHKSPDSSSLFMEKAVKMLKDGGILGFIAPKSLSYVVSWKPIREFLLNECGIVEIADTSKAFKGVLLEQMVIIARKWRESSASTTISILRPESSVVSHSIDRMALSGERFSIWLGSRQIKDIVDRIWENSVPLGHLAEIWNGISAQSLGKHDRPCLRGRDIQRYQIRRDVQYIKTTDHPSPEPFRKPKIVAQDIVAHINNPIPHIKLTATIDRSAAWLNANTVTNIASSEYCLEYLCGILNSRLISWYAYDFIYNRSTRTMHFRRGYADHIPIRNVDAGAHSLQEQLVERVNRMINFHDEGAAENEIAQVDREIDELIYQLYDITAEDVNFLREHAGLFTQA